MQKHCFGVRLRYLPKMTGWMRPNPNWQNRKIPRRTEDPKGFPGADRARGANKEDDLNDDSWSVQVGAYNRFAPAHLAAGHAARLVPALRGARVMIESSASAKERIYLSRLSELTEKRANSACNALKKKNMTCLVIRDDNNTAQGDR